MWEGDLFYSVLSCLLNFFSNQILWPKISLLKLNCYLKKILHWPFLTLFNFLIFSEQNFFYTFGAKFITMQKNARKSSRALYKRLKWMIISREKTSLFCQNIWKLYRSVNFKMFFWYHRFDQKTNGNLLKISALASKKMSIQKNKATLSQWSKWPIFVSLHYWHAPRSARGVQKSGRPNWSLLWSVRALRFSQNWRNCEKPSKLNKNFQRNPVFWRFFKFFSIWA